MKTCSKCKTEQPLDQFKKVQGGKYLDSWCKLCNRKAAKLRYHETKEANRDKRNEAARRRKIEMHGISIDQYEEILIAQDGTCALCDRTEDGKRLAIDHDHACCPGSHSCGKCVRGLLCGPCNTAIGLFRDDVKVMTKAIKYVRNEHG